MSSSVQGYDKVNGAAQSNSSSSAGTNSAGDLENTFLTLLIAQLKNQDPTSPMDSSQFTSQLAQINTVSGIAQLNTTLNSLAAQLNASQQSQAANLIGSTVLAPGNGIAVSDGKASGFGVQLASDASDVQVTIKNSAGQIVSTMDLGKMSAGNTPVGWKPVDKQGNALPDGNYTFEVSATIDGKPGTPVALSAAKVDGVIKQADGSAGLVLSNGNTVPFSSIAAII